ncbi:endonuclease domain-containing protein [Pseudaminobacter sp. NGMCC 1.201702]|uniref:endonuclease domain-containing protein n=1 Tax=Pseudaminobacter sp. NGMCC 1.201702 TaxID=3391825 RepID=UPI0039EED9F8
MADPTKRKPGATARARLLRANETEAEYRLWGELRGRHLNGYKFTRQVPLGSYVVDFLCREKMLIVEVDGSQHADAAWDERRTKWLNARGYSVLRFWNQEVLAERRSVLETILAVLDGRISSPSPGLRFAPATLSPRGEEVENHGRPVLRHGRVCPEVRQVAAGVSSPLGERVAGAKRRPGEGGPVVGGRQSRRDR